MTGKNDFLPHQLLQNSQNPNELIETIFNHVAEGIMITDKHKKIVSVNPAFEVVTGYKSEEVVGGSPSVLQSGIHEKQFYLNMWSSIYEQGYWQGEIWNRRKTGDVYPEWLTIVEVKDATGTVNNYCGIFTDLSERKLAENKIEQTLFRDSLTDIANRLAYNERMDLLLEKSNDAQGLVQHAVYFLDLKRFKQINDTLGHSVADLLLREVANRIQSLISNRDILARFGSDEFIITKAFIQSHREAITFADKVFAEIEKPFLIDGQEIFISTSMGISLYPMDGETTDQLINNADKAMTYSKEQNMSRYVFYFDELHKDTKRLLLLDAELRHAIKEGNFELHLQPKICLQKNTIMGVEALVRWHSEKLGFVSPAEFIPHAEETGLIIPLSEIIFEKACEAHIAMREAGYEHVPIAVNISSIHFQQQTFLQSIQNILMKYNVSANNFIIELTERTVMSNATETVSKLVRLKQLGFKLSIDDFGTGYSSLSYLVRFPLDYLKIDRSFILQMTSLDEKQAVVDAIIQMSHRLKMKVIAEGVESKDQVKMLERMECDYIQGYYFSKPLPLQELLQFIEFWEVEQQGR